MMGAVVDGHDLPESVPSLVYYSSYCTHRGGDVRLERHGPAQPIALKPNRFGRLITRYSSSSLQQRRSNNHLA